MEPLLAPALAQAAKDLADSRLADPDLSTAMLARELNVSVRTLQRAFTVAGESLTTYIRHRATVRRVAASARVVSSRTSRSCVCTRGDYPAA